MMLNTRFGAYRHKIWVKNKAKSFVPSHTGRDMPLDCSFYPYQIPNGIVPENYKSWRY
jgi:hypothetical protein